MDVTKGVDPYGVLIGWAIFLFNPLLFVKIDGAILGRWVFTVCVIVWWGEGGGWRYEEHWFPAYIFGHISSEKN